MLESQFWLDAVLLKMSSPDLQPWHHPGTCQKHKFSGPIADLLSLKLWGWSPVICVLIIGPISVAGRGTPSRARNWALV